MAARRGAHDRGDRQQWHAILALLAGCRRHRAWDDHHRVRWNRCHESTLPVNIAAH